MLYLIINNINNKKYIDYLVDGQFIEEQKNPKLKYAGSSNQRLIDVKKSLEENKTITINM